MMGFLVGLSVAISAVVALALALLWNSLRGWTSEAGRIRAQLDELPRLKEVARELEGIKGDIAASLDRGRSGLSYQLKTVELCLEKSLEVHKLVYSVYRLHQKTWIEKTEVAHNVAYRAAAELRQRLFEEQILLADEVFRPAMDCVCSVIAAHQGAAQVDIEERISEALHQTSQSVRSKFGLPAIPPELLEKTAPEEVKKLEVAGGKC